MGTPMCTARGTGGIQRKDREEPNFRGVSQGGKQATKERKSVCNPGGGRKTGKNKNSQLCDTQLPGRASGSCLGDEMVLNAGQQSGEADSSYRVLGTEALLCILQGEWKIKWDGGRQTTLRKSFARDTRKGCCLRKIQGQFSKVEDRPWCLYSDGKGQIEWDTNGIGSSQGKCPKERNDEAVKGCEHHSKKEKESIGELSEHFSIPSELRSREKEQGMCPLDGKEKDMSYLRNESLYIMKI